MNTLVHDRRPSENSSFRMFLFRMFLSGCRVSASFSQGCGEGKAPSSGGGRGVCEAAPCSTKASIMRWMAAESGGVPSRAALLAAASSFDSRLRRLNSNLNASTVISSCPDSLNLTQSSRHVGTWVKILWHQTGKDSTRYWRQPLKIVVVGSP